MRIGSSWRNGYSFWNYCNSPNWGHNFMTGNYTYIADRSGNVAGNNTSSATPDSVFNNVVEGSYGQLPDPPLDFEHEKQAYGDWLQTVHAARVTLGPGAFAPVVYHRRARHVPRPLVRRSSDPCCR